MYCFAGIYNLTYLPYSINVLVYIAFEWGPNQFYHVFHFANMTTQAKATAIMYNRL